MMQGFRSAGGLQRFIAVSLVIGNQIVLCHQKHTALATYIHRIRAVAQSKAVTGAAA
jgi:putative transposase